MANISGLKEHYDTYGLKMMWVLSGGTSSAQAYSYFSGYGADFGWFTNDVDNSLGSEALVSTPMVEGVPWVMVIDGETMEILYNNPMSLYSIARDLYND